MTLAELIDIFRTRAEDIVAPYLWSDTEITMYLNEANKEAAERALLIQDETTALVCTLTLAADTATYALHPSILRIERAKLTSNGELLKIVAREYLDATWDKWESATGTPQYIIENADGNVRIVPTPTAIDTITLIVKRLPITPMSLPADTPEISSRHHYRMVDWALHLAYMKPDADAGNKGAADRYDEEFSRSFGYRLDANVQRKQRDRRIPVVRASW